MIKPDLSQPLPETLGRLHFVGIGGSGMSGIARMFHDRGHAVSGSDRAESAAVDSLRGRGIPEANKEDAAEASHEKYHGERTVDAITAWADELMKQIKKETPFIGVNAPLHKGAIRYYREAGVKIPSRLIPPKAK